MALSTKADLKASILSWMARTDADVLASAADDFIRLFEVWANRNVRALDMQARATLTPNVSGSATLPADFLDTRRVTSAGSPKRVLEYVAPDYFDASNPANAGGLPNYYTIEGSSLLVSPVSTSDLTLLYWQSLPALDADADANWLLTKYPDVYLAGALTAAYTFEKNYDEAGIWKGVRDEAVARINRQATDAQGPSAIRPYGATP